MKRDFKHELVISGMSARLPKSNNLDEFWDNLESGTDMIEECSKRWRPGLFDLPSRFGILRDTDKFDATFFGIHGKQAAAVHPSTRMLTEVSYESIIDAGINPETLRGSNIGVFCGGAELDGKDVDQRSADKITAFSLIGDTANMIANRLSFFFDFHGPSFTIETACSSSLYALNQAVLSLRNGECDAALVAGTCHLLDPVHQLSFQRLGILSPNGQCRSFDIDGDGMVQAEAICCLFIQKKDVALRSYATVLHTKTNSDGYKEEGITFPSTQLQEKLLRDTLAEAGVHPDEVSYFECHGTGTRAGDPQELNAITNVFCKNRTASNPLLIGSVKSNMGHAMGAAGTASIIKVLMGAQKGIIPANLLFKNPNQGIPALLDGRLKVVTENLPWKGGIIMINSFGFGGANGTCLLECPIISEAETTKAEDPTSGLPRLILLSGRTKDTVESGLKKVVSLITSNGKGKEIVPLLHNIFERNISKHPVRGFVLVNEESQPASDVESQQHLEDNTIVTGSVSNIKPEIWFVFSGMGSQYVNMGSDLYRSCKIFRASMDKCANILKDKVDLIDLVMNAAEEVILNSLLNSFTLIISIQISLVDLLTHLNILPTGLIGHSLGETAAAYADNCFTTEQALYTAVTRAQAINDLIGKTGAMAAVGLSWDEAKLECPEGVYAACHNSVDSVTISGDEQKVQSIVKDLKSRNILATMVRTAGHAFHCPRMMPAGEPYRAELNKILPPFKKRSTKWISTSVAEGQKDEEWTREAGSQYMVNNFLSPVLFHDAISKIPENALVVEIGAHCLFQGILKGSLPGRIHVPLMHKKHADSTKSFFYLLQSLGTCYVNGLNPRVSALYGGQQQQFPVPSNTPTISPIVEWDHSVSHCVVSPVYAGKDIFSETVKISLLDEDAKFFLHHMVSNRLVFPAAGYIYYTWKCFAALVNMKLEDCPVIFQNIRFRQFVVFPTDTSSVELSFRFMMNTGEFEIVEYPSENLVVTGRVARMEKSQECGTSEESEFPETADVVKGDDSIPIENADFYLECKTRGLHFGESFKSILEADSKGQWAFIKWTGNWVTFLDGLFQLNETHNLVSPRLFSVPFRIDQVSLDPAVFLQHVKSSSTSSEPSNLNPNPTTHIHRKENSSPGSTEVFAQMSLETNTASCPGVEVCGLNVTIKGKANQMSKQTGLDKNVLLQNCQFSAYFDKNSVNASITTCLAFLISIVAENRQHRLNILEINENLNSDKAKSTLITSEVIRKNISPDSKFTLFCPTSNSSSEIQDLNSKSITVVPISLEDFHDTQKLTSTMTSAPFDLVIVEQDLSLLTKTLSNLQPLGFLLYHCIQSEPTLISGHVNAAENTDLVSIKFSRRVQKGDSEYEDDDLSESFDCFYLFRKQDLNISQSTPTRFIKVKQNFEENDGEWGWVEQVKLAMEEHQGEPKRICLYADDEYSGVLGLFKCLKMEPRGEILRCVYVRNKNNGLKEEEINDQLKFDLKVNIWEEGQWGRYAHVPCDFPTYEISHSNTKHVLPDLDCVYLEQLRSGDISTLHWTQGNLHMPKAGSETGLCECDVHFVAMNFKDSLMAMGKVPFEVIPKKVLTQPGLFGWEFSGTTADGKRVMGTTTDTTAFCTKLFVPKNTLFEIPADWTMAEGATVQVAYITSILSLIVKGGMKAGETVLVHSGAGALGQACITLALSHGCKVYTTTSNEEKRHFLKKSFPQLTDAQIFNSRNSSFEKQIMKTTKGRGVDIVVNSLAGDLLEAGIRCCARGGRFLELGKVDMLENTKIGVSYLFRDVTVLPVMLDHTPVESPDLQKAYAVFLQNVQNKVIRPISPLHLYSMDNVEEAFRFMLTGKHMGKIVVQMRDGRNEQITANALPPTPPTFKGVPRTQFHPDKVYIVIGGFGGLGLEMVQWMIERHARKIVIVSRSGIKTGYQQLCFRRWTETYQASVTTSQVDLTSAEETHKFFLESKEVVGQKVGGIFNLALSLHDGLIENQSVETFQAAFRPKGQITFNLDQMTRKFAATVFSELDYFVCTSSISSGLGHPAQTNYGYANNVMERICENRKKSNLPALVIQYGAVAEVGVLARTKVTAMKTPQNLSHLHHYQSVISCIKSLDLFLLESRNVCSPCIFSSWAYQTEEDGKRSDASDGSERRSLLEKVGQIIGIADLQTNPSYLNATLAELGLDSLLGIELKTVFEDHGFQLSTTRVRNITVAEVQKMSNDEESLDKTDDTNKECISSIILGGDHLYLQNGFIAEEALVSLNQTLKQDQKQTELKRKIFIVHSADGFVSPVKELGFELDNDFEVWGLQSIACDEQTSIPQIAQLYIERIKRIQPGGPYFLAGFSFGCVVAFEMAVELERRGEEVGQLILIDGSPRYIRVVAELYSGLRIDQDESLVDDIQIRAIGKKEEASIVRVYFSQFSSHKLDEMFQILSSMSSLEQMFDVVSKEIHSSVPHVPIENIVHSVRGYCQRIVAGYLYQPSRRLEAPCVLIKASSTLKSRALAADYGLISICKGPLEIHEVKGDHRSIVLKPQVHVTAKWIRTSIQFYTENKKKFL